MCVVWCERSGVECIDGPYSGQAVLAVYDLLACVDQEEATGAVYFFCLSPREAQVTTSAAC
jgi:hypothetical protein